MCYDSWKSPKIYTYCGPNESDANGNVMLPKIVWSSKMPAIKFLYRSLWVQIFTRKVPSLKKKYEKKRSWPDVGPRSAWEKLSQMFNSKRRDSESSTDRQKQRLRHEIRTGRVREGFRPTLWSQCSQRGRWYVAGAGQESDTKHLAAGM